MKILGACVKNLSPKEVCFWDSVNVFLGFCLFGCLFFEKKTIHAKFSLDNLCWICYHNAEFLVIEEYETTNRFFSSMRSILKRGCLPSETDNLRQITEEKVYSFCAKSGLHRTPSTE